MDNDLINENPLISVVMPVFNGEKYLPGAIESILSQTFKEFEFIIIDDASTDQTPHILQFYKKKDPRIKVFKNEKNQKISYCLNRGINIAKADIIARMDADDISLPKRFETQYKLLHFHKNIHVCGTAIKIKETGEVKNVLVNNSSIKARLLFEPCINHPTVFFRKSVFSKNNEYYSLDMPPAEDYDLWIKMAKDKDIIFANIPVVHLIYRIHPERDKVVYTCKQEEKVAIVQTRLFENLNVAFTKDEKLFHNILAHRKFVDTIEIAKKCEEWLLKLRKSVNQYEYCLTEDIDRECLRNWIRICLQLASKHNKLKIVSLFFSSPIIKGKSILLLCKVLFKKIILKTF